MLVLLIRKSTQVPKTVEFRFFTKILHILGVQDETMISDKSSSLKDPSVWELETLAAKCMGRRRGTVSGMIGEDLREELMMASMRSEVVEEEVRMVTLRECLDAILRHDVYQVSLS